MKTYHDIVGDGGSNVIAQAQAQQRAIGDALSGVRHRLAIGSGKCSAPNAWPPRRRVPYRWRRRC